MNGEAPDHNAANTQAPGAGSYPYMEQVGGIYIETLDNVWTAEYSEDVESGLWQVNVFKHDVSEWRGAEFGSLQEARQSVRDYYDQI